MNVKVCISENKFHYLRINYVKPSKQTKESKKQINSLHKIMIYLSNFENNRLNLYSNFFDFLNNKKEKNVYIFAFVYEPEDLKLISAYISNYLKKHLFNKSNTKRKKIISKKILEKKNKMSKLNRYQYNKTLLKKKMTDIKDKINKIKKKFTGNPNLIENTLTIKNDFFDDDEKDFYRIKNHEFLLNEKLNSSFDSNKESSNNEKENENYHYNNQKEDNKSNKEYQSQSGFEIDNNLKKGYNNSSSTNISFMFSNPNDFNMTINYIPYLNQIITKFQNKSLSYEVKNLTDINIREALKKDVKIIHLFVNTICIFKDGIKENYLVFENHSTYNRINMSSKELNEIFTEKHYNLDLIIINTMHIKQCEEIFANIPNLKAHVNIIYVYTDFSILDPIQINFLEAFYELLLENKELKYSLSSSINLIHTIYESGFSRICCCFHSHESNCSLLFRENNDQKIELSGSVISKNNPSEEYLGHTKTFKLEKSENYSRLNDHNNLKNGNFNINNNYMYSYHLDHLHKCFCQESLYHDINCEDYQSHPMLFFETDDKKLIKCCCPKFSLDHTNSIISSDLSTENYDAIIFDNEFDSTNASIPNYESILIGKYLGTQEFCNNEFILDYYPLMSKYKILINYILGNKNDYSMIRVNDNDLEYVTNIIISYFLERNLIEEYNIRNIINLKCSSIQGSQSNSNKFINSHLKNKNNEDNYESLKKSSSAYSTSKSTLIFFEIFTELLSNTKENSKSLNIIIIESFSNDILDILEDKKYDNNLFNNFKVIIIFIKDNLSSSLYSCRNDTKKYSTITDDFFDRKLSKVKSSTKSIRDIRNIFKCQKFTDIETIMALRYLNYLNLPQYLTNNIQLFQIQDFIKNSKGIYSNIKKISNIFNSLNYSDENYNESLSNAIEEINNNVREESSNMEKVLNEDLIYDIFKKYDNFAWITKDHCHFIIELLFYMYLNYEGLSLTDLDMILEDFQNNLLENSEDNQKLLEISNELKKNLSDVLSNLVSDKLFINKIIYKSDFYYFLQDEYFDIFDTNKNMLIKYYEKIFLFYAKKLRQFINNFNSEISEIEFSSTQNYGMWLSVSEDIYLTQKFDSNIKETDKEMFFKFYKPGLNRIFKEEILLEIMQMSSKDYENNISKNTNYLLSPMFLEAFEQISISYPTLIFYFKSSIDDIFNSIYFCQIFLEKLFLDLPKARLLLFSAYVCLKKDIKNDIQLIIEECADIFKEYNFLEGLIEIEFFSIYYNFEVSDKTKDFKLNSDALISKLINLDQYVSTMIDEILYFLNEYEDDYFNKEFPKDSKTIILKNKLYNLYLSRIRINLFKANILKTYPEYSNQIWYNHFHEVINLIDFLICQINIGNDNKILSDKKVYYTIINKFNLIFIMKMKIINNIDNKVDKSDIKISYEAICKEVKLYIKRNKSIIGMITEYNRLVG